MTHTKKTAREHDRQDSELDLETLEHVTGGSILSSVGDSLNSISTSTITSEVVNESVGPDYLVSSRSRT